MPKMVRSHRPHEADPLVRAQPILNSAGDCEGFLPTWPTEADCQTLRFHERSGVPIEGADFIDKVEDLLRRRLRPQKRERGNGRINDGVPILFGAINAKALPTALRAVADHHSSGLANAPFPL